MKNHTGKVTYDSIILSDQKKKFVEKAGVLEVVLTTNGPEGFFGAMEIVLELDCGHC